MTVKIYCDGACKGNGTGGPGGWGVWAPDQGSGLCFYGGEPVSTNNRMELTAAIRAHQLIRELGLRDVLILTDSQYVINGLTSWIKGWKAKGWQTANGPVKNQELWTELDALYQELKPTLQWVKGHSGDPGNEMADSLSNKGVVDHIGVGISSAKTQLAPTARVEQAPHALPKSTATPDAVGLLVINMQKALAPPSELISGINGLNVENYQLVAFSQFINEGLSLHRSVLGDSSCGKQDANLVELTFPPGVVLQTTVYGLSNDCLRVLQDTGIKTWHLCGMGADSHVLAVGYALWSVGLKPLVLKELVQADTKKAKEAGLVVFKNSFGAHSLLG